ncbi:MAG: ATP synthase F1 subunit gamma [Planctomycetes bacterium]|nr:ATP synthase F1 subunit gamma [Planctomycetota bacterium]
MATIRDLRDRIDSVGSIQKITRAMEMVATTKLRRFQGKTVAAKPYSERLNSLVAGLSGSIENDASAAGSAATLFAPGNSDAPVGVLFVGSDRGLCGAYNSNIQRKLDAELAAIDGEYVLYVVGKKAMAHAARCDYPVAAYFEEFDLEKMTVADATSLASALVNDFRQGKVSSMNICSTLFVSAARYTQGFEQFLPIVTLGGDDSAANDAILEPTGPELLGELIPRYLENRFYQSFLEAITSEYASRRFAMKGATDAASDMKKDITRLYNRARQAKITQEISEIVSGAAAL